MEQDDQEEEDEDCFIEKDGTEEIGDVEFKDAEELLERTRRVEEHKRIERQKRCEELEECNKGVKRLKRDIFAPTR